MGNYLSNKFQDLKECCAELNCRKIQSCCRRGQPFDYRTDVAKADALASGEKKKEGPGGTLIVGGGASDAKGLMDHEDDVPLMGLTSDDMDGGDASYNADAWQSMRLDGVDFSAKPSTSNHEDQDHSNKIDQQLKQTSSAPAPPPAVAPPSPQTKKKDSPKKPSKISSSSKQQSTSSDHDKAEAEFAAAFQSNFTNLDADGFALPAATASAPTVTNNNETTTTTTTTTKKKKKKKDANATTTPTGAAAMTESETTSDAEPNLSSQQTKHRKTPGKTKSGTGPKKAPKEKSGDSSGGGDGGDIGKGSNSSTGKPKKKKTSKPKPPPPDE